MNSPLGGNRLSPEVTTALNKSQAAINMLTILVEFLIESSDKPDDTKKKLRSLIDKHPNMFADMYVNSNLSNIINMLK